jgi:hypothetical protein
MAKLTRTEIRSLADDIAVELEALKQRYYNDYKQLFIKTNFFQILNNKIQAVCTTATDLGIYNFLCDVSTAKETPYYGNIREPRRLNIQDFKDWIIKEIIKSINDKFPYPYSSWELDRKITVENVTVLIPDAFKMRLLQEYEDKCVAFIEETKKDLINQ